MENGFYRRRVALLGLAATFAAIPVRAQEAPNELEQALRKLAEVYAVAEENAASPVDANHAIYEGALPALLRTLDPHSVFFTAGQFDQLRELEQSTSKGFGTVVSVLPGRVIVLQAMPGSPSARAGIAPGDEILAINGYRIDWLDLEQLIGLLGESRRREARLDVRRQGNSRILSFTLSPADIDSPSVDRAFFLEPGIAYVRVSSFEADTAKLMKAAIAQLDPAAIRGLVLDLRNNQGGILTAGLETAAFFLPPGARVATLRGRARPSEEVKVPEGATPWLFPLAVLVNEKTASAAEIVAGAMQDHDRAVVVGTSTFGKGLVQSVFPLSEGAGLALTTAFYFTPSGRSIQKPLEGASIQGVPRWTGLEDGTEFKTASGRTVRGGGGIEPDHRAPPEAMTRLRAYLDASAAITSFATAYLGTNKSVDAGFEVNDAVVEQFRVYLLERNAQPSVSEWSADREWIRSRLLQEIFNQALGVDKGDEVEARRDREVQRAIDLLKGR